MQDVILLMTQFLNTVISETHYVINAKSKVVYPYLTFNYTSQPFYRSNGNEVYIDFDIFDNQKNDYERIEKCADSLTKAVEAKKVLMNDSVMIRLEGVSLNHIPTGSDTLQRKSGTINLRIDWRKL